MTRLAGDIGLRLDVRLRLLDVGLCLRGWHTLVWNLWGGCWLPGGQRLWSRWLGLIARRLLWIPHRLDTTRRPLLVWVA